MTRGWHLTRAYAALLLVTSLGALALSSPASAAPVDVTPNVARLPVGAAPAIPYVQWPKRTIVDGNRRVSISGIKGRVYALYKVDGGYLLRRDVPGPSDNDVVFVSSRGERRVLVSDVMDNSVALVVSSGGDKVMVNVSPAGQSHDSYGETRVYALPSGQLLVRKHFAGFVALEAFGVNRALLEYWDQATRDYSVIWWTPATDTVDLMSQGTTAPGLDAVDLTAWDWSFRRPGDWELGPLHVRGLPSHTSPDWDVPGDETNLLAWSPDDSRIVGKVERDGDDGNSYLYRVYGASDGALQLSVRNSTPPQATWESDSRLLLRTRLAEDSYQLIRCTLAGNCSRVGPRYSDYRGAIIPATRRN